MSLLDEGHHYSACHLLSPSTPAASRLTARRHAAIEFPSRADALAALALISRRRYFMRADTLTAACRRRARALGARASMPGEAIFSPIGIMYHYHWPSPAHSQARVQTPVGHEFYGVGRFHSAIRPMQACHAGSAA